MERSDVLSLYDANYADAYDLRFLLSPWAKSGADFEEEAIRGLLAVDSSPRWLDVACGTGYFLARFPDVRRAGFDLSPSMVAKASEANPTSEFIAEHNMLDDRDDWHDAWSLLSCMWTPYNYLQSIWEVERLIDNMIRWTRPGGACFIPVMDLEDLRHVQVPYDEEPGEFGGSIALTSVTWTWIEPVSELTHQHLIAPHIGHFVERFKHDFEVVEVVRYPLFQNAGPSRKALVAQGRRPRRDGVVAEIVWHDPPLPVVEEPDPAAGVEREVESAAEVDSAGDVEAEAEVESRAEVESAGDVDTAAEVEPAAANPPYTALPTSVLAGELARRVNPFNERFWRGIRRRFAAGRNR